MCRSMPETPTPVIRSRFNDHLNEAHTAPLIDVTVVSHKDHLADYISSLYLD